MSYGQKVLSPSRPRYLRLNVILVVVCLVGDLDGVPLGDDADVALDVALAAAGSVVRVSQHRPLVVELSLCTHQHRDNHDTRPHDGHLAAASLWLCPA